MISCGIVTYNPDVELLKKNIDAICGQVEQVVIVDNYSENIDEIHLLALNYRNCFMIKNNKNMGIAKALNQACAYASESGYQWIVTLDQDSVCPGGFVDGLFDVVSMEQRVGIVAPLIVDRNVGVVGHHPKGSYKDVRTCITSGALTNLNAWNAVGGFDEKMFIDSVDFEFCYRLRKNKYKIIQTPEVKLLHSIGEGKKHKILFWQFTNCEHSAFRNYYIAQNNIYYPKKHRLYLHLFRGNLRNLKKIFIVLFYETEKTEKVRAIIKGWKKGYRI